MNKFDVQYITSSYTLSYGSTLMLAGRLSDVYGHKFCLMIGLALFAAFTVPSAMARSSLELAIYRAIQGLGASAISPPLFAILARSFKHGTTMRTEGFATLSAGSPLGSSVGLFLGGWLTEFTGPGWKTFFYFSLAFSLCAIICAWIILPPDPPPTTKKGFKDVDWIGATLLVTGLTVLVATLSFNTRFGWNLPQMYIPFLSSHLIVGAFFAWEFFFERKWSRQPLLPLSLFRKRYFAAIQCVAGLLYMAYTDHSYFVLQYFQKYLHLSLDDTLVRMLPILIVGLGLNLVTGHFAHILPAQLMIIVGCLSTTTACALSSIMNPSASYWAYNFFAIGLSVVGADFVFSVGAMFGSNIADDDEQAIAGAVILSSTR
ncbi:hypothetical protein CROQUDRAFT_39406 [Cronartium quercuum f. sp. fusiforme G11]|uniref:Major facilitator superfamily (MFS) profile domain-containing protein n=1 Tax=Cronartium quercuum f. sp. fusiforme G11 TaxID=708437 RepID=A0A9P6NQD8_9BASI|nr:hypothetical protein CROQUDRAFT_39406 [Cronartium quercuum f. sp. fusiforme G11]